MLFPPIFCHHLGFRVRPMVSRSDLVESFPKSVKDAISPLESGFLSFSRDLESHWSNDSRNEPRNVEFFARSNGLMKKKPNLDPSVLLPSSSDEKKKGFKIFIGSIFPNSSKKRGAKEEEEEQEESCSNCLQNAVTWSIVVNNFVQAFPSPLKSVKKCFRNPCVQQDDLKPKQRQKLKRSDLRNKEKLWLESLLCFALDNLVQNLQMFDHRKLISGIIKGKKADVNGLLANIRFARVGGAPASLVEGASSVNGEGESRVSNVDKEEAESGSTQKPSGGILNIPFSTVESLKSTLSTISLTELIEFIPQLRKSSSEHPDKKKLFSVQDFFWYTETEGFLFNSYLGHVWGKGGGIKLLEWQEFGHFQPTTLFGIVRACRRNWADLPSRPRPQKMTTNSDFLQQTRVEDMEGVGATSITLQFFFPP